MAPSRILVVEDESIIAADLQDTLEGMGFQVVGVVTTGEGAIQLADAHRPDLVLMDIMLKGELSGIGAAGRIREQFDIPVIFLTAFADEQVLSAAKHSVPFGYLLKPFEERLLGATIEMALYKHATDRQLREQERWMRATLRSIGDAVLTADAAGTLLSLNPAAEALTGWAQDEAVGRRLEEVCPLRDLVSGASFLPARVETLLQADPADPIAHTVLTTRGGEAVPVDGSLSLIRDEWDGAWGMVLVMRDVSERDRIARALVEEKERLRVTLQSIGDAVIATDTAGCVVLMNPIAEMLTGWLLSDAYGRPLDEIFPIINEQTRRPCANPVTKVLESGTIVGLANHTALIARDGTECIIADSGAPIRDAAGAIIGVVLVFRDITTQSRLEEELAKAQKLESLGVLAGGIAHDFNNLLTGILGNLSLIRASLAPHDRLLLPVTHAETAACRARDLTQQLLTFASGGAPMKRKVQLPTLLDETVGFALHGSNVQCALELPPELWSIEADETQLAQVMSNLTINAAQAMPDGGLLGVCAENLTLTPDTALPLPPGPYVCIRVRDTGMGIAEKDLSHIFDPFFTTKQQGKGLGLAVAHSIIVRHDGHITVDSLAGAGTTFTLYLPAGRQAVAAAPAPSTTVPLGHGRILLMDDEALVRETAGCVLDFLGYTVTLAVEGQEAVTRYGEALAAGEPYAAVILDLTVPGGLGGEKTLDALRALDPGVRAIVSSGYSQDPIMAHFADYGFCAAIAKPYRLEELARVLAECLEG